MKNVCYNVDSSREQYKINEGDNTMKLVWNDVENGWVCSDCSAIYGETEVERAFGNREQIPENFYESFCMDCGCLWKEAVK